MWRLTKLTTTLRADEANVLDDLGISRGVRRSHITRAALRFTLAHMDEFREWLATTDDIPEENPEDRLPDGAQVG